MVEENGASCDCVDEWSQMQLVGVPEPTSKLKGVASVVGRSRSIAASSSGADPAADATAEDLDDGQLPVMLTWTI